MLARANSCSRSEAMNQAMPTITTRSLSFVDHPDLFKVISTNKYCATIEAEHGLLFDGSLNHAGAKVNYIGCQEEAVVNEVEYSVRSCRRDNKSAVEFEKIFNKLCSIEGLSSICRLHIALFPKGKEIFNEPNAVGRTGCPDNAEFY
jgi:hypothetical protein